MKKYLWVGISIFALFFCLLGLSAYVTYLTAQSYWVLRLILIVFFIILLAIVFWFGFKFVMIYKNSKIKNKEYEINTYDTEVEKLDYLFLDKVLNMETYKRTKGTFRDILHYLYSKKNESSNQPNIMLVNFYDIDDIIKKDNNVEQILLIHDVPADENKTLILVNVLKGRQFADAVVELNNPRNFNKNKYYCAYCAETKVVTFGAKKELLQFDGYKNMNKLVQEIFKVEEITYGESKK